MTDQITQAAESQVTQKALTWRWQREILNAGYLSPEPIPFPTEKHMSVVCVWVCTCFLNKLFILEYL